MKTIRIAGAQINPTVGDFVANERRILDAMQSAESLGADILALPELVITGYPPEDLVLKESFVNENLAVLNRLAAFAGETLTVIGFVDRVDGVAGDDSQPRCLANAAALLHRGRIVGVYHKLLLPNYGVFDEARYFDAGSQPAMVWTIAGVTVGVSICEDIWSADGPPAMQAAAGADILVNINGSPYHRGKRDDRRDLLARQAIASSTPIVYLNMVGGQDELVFDGDSMVFNSRGEIVARSPQFVEHFFCLDLEIETTDVVPTEPVFVTDESRGGRDLEQVEIWPELDEAAEIYKALVAGLHDYVLKSGFSSVIIGLSGGIDSALTAAIAVDALGPDAVWGVTMPTRYSSPGSVSDSVDLASRLGCRCDVIPIDDTFESFLTTLGATFADTSENVAEENLQARIRGATLMAISNKFGGLVIPTGNKSEMAVGYATLYGDMAGGYAVLKDVLKTTVYELAKWRNMQGEVIPLATIDKAPSAELRPDQQDSDSLPEYGVLDQIIVEYVERDASVDSIVALGVDLSTVLKITTLIDQSEYKRRQSAPGVRITEKAFGRDRRLPIINRFRG